MRSNKCQTFYTRNQHHKSKPKIYMKVGSLCQYRIFRGRKNLKYSKFFEFSNDADDIWRGDKQRHTKFWRNPGIYNPQKQGPSIQSRILGRHRSPQSPYEIYPRRLLHPKWSQANRLNSAVSALQGRCRRGENGHVLSQRS